MGDTGKKKKTEQEQRKGERQRARNIGDAERCIALRETKRQRTVQRKKRKANEVHRGRAGKGEEVL